MTTITTAPGIAGAARSKHVGTIACAGTIGTIIEWYDFLIYGTAAALVFNSQFFPKFDPRIGTLAALGAFAVGFLARPIGGAIFGHFGDRLGRKSMLMLTMVSMGLSTAAIGVLPTYAQIGIVAPVLLVLLRVVQGIAPRRRMGRRILDGARTCAAASPRPLWKLRASRLSHWACGGVGGVRPGVDAAGRGVQDLGLAHSIHHQHPFGRHWSVRPRPASGNPGIRGDQGTRSDCPDSVGRNGAEKPPRASWSRLGSSSPRYHGFTCSRSSWSSTRRRSLDCRER